MRAKRNPSNGSNEKAVKAAQCCGEKIQIIMQNHRLPGQVESPVERVVEQSNH